MSAAFQTEVPIRRMHETDDTNQLDKELRELVQKFAVNGDLETSISEILDVLDSRPDLDYRFRSRAAGAMLYDARNQLRAGMQKAAWTIPEAHLANNAARIAGRLSLYDFPLPGVDVRMGDATAADLEQAAGYHDARVANEQARSTMYRQIAGMLKKAKKLRVRDGIREDRLAEVMRGAQ